MRTMTGYGRGEVDHDGAKFSVELNSVNRKQSDIVINLPRDLDRIGAAHPPNDQRKTFARPHRMCWSVCTMDSANGARKLALDTALARSYHDAMRALQKELSAPGEITIGTILQAPGVMRVAGRSDQAGRGLARGRTRAARALSRI